MNAPPAIRDRFMADHRRIEEVLEHVLEALEGGDRDEVRRLWRELETRLIAHFEAEEKHAIPRLIAARPRDGQALPAEHKHLRTRLAELGNEIDLGTARLEAVQGFVDELRAHARHEDAVLYRWCDDHLEVSDRTVLVRSLVDVVRNMFRPHAAPAGFKTP
jgi:hypothetical protein